MNRIPRTMACAAAGALVFCVLLERVSLPGALLGAAVGAAGGFCAPAEPGGTNRPVRYGLYLLREMAAGTVHMVRAALGRRPFPIALLRLPPTARGCGRAVVANSMTLTPGTVTLEETEARYVVLCADPPADEAARAAVVGGFETRLRRKEEGHA